MNTTSRPVAGERDARSQPGDKGRWTPALLAAVAAIALTFALTPLPAVAHPANDYVSVYNPLSDGDADYSDVTAAWATTRGTEPASHHIVYSNWGYRNDWSVDIFGPPGRRIVSPFGTKTASGHATRVTVVGKQLGCASGRYEDGGYRITVEAKDTQTGQVLGRADLMHVATPQVSVGTALGPWTVIGKTSRFRYSSCYQVNNDAGVHVHAEFINLHSYACYIRRGNGAPLTELTVVGRVGVHYAGARAAC